MGCSNSSLIMTSHKKKSQDAVSRRSGESTVPAEMSKVPDLREFRPHVHPGGITTMAISEDMSLLVTCGEDFKAKMWSTFSNPTELLGTLEGHSGYITSCALSGAFVFTGSADATIRKWSCLESECLWVYNGHERGPINRILVVGRYLFSSSYDKTARVWFADLEKMDLELGYDPAMDPILISHQDSVESSNTMIIPRPRDCLHVLCGHERGVYPLLFVPDPNNDLSSRTIYAADILLTGSLDCTVRTWSHRTGECLKVLRHPDAVTCLALDPFCPGHVFSAGGDSKIRCWDLVTGDLIRELSGHDNNILCLLPFNRMLYSGSTDRTARCWIMEFGDNTRTYFRARGGISSLKYFDGMLFTGSTDCCARVYDAKSGTLKRTYRAHASAITSMEVVPGKLFTGSYDGHLIVWSTDGLREDSVFGQQSAVNPLAEDPEEESENVRHALRKLEPHMKHFTRYGGGVGGSEGLMRSHF